MSEQDKLDVIAAILAAGRVTPKTDPLDIALLFKAVKHALQFTGFNGAPLPESGREYNDLKNKFEKSISE